MTCTHCGAVFNGTKCEYCGTDYNPKVQYGSFSTDNRTFGTLTVNGVDYEVYLSEMTCHNIHSSERDYMGNLRTILTATKRVFKFIEK